MSQQEIENQREVLEKLTDLAHMLKELTIQQHKINQKIVTVLRICDKRLCELEVNNEHN